MTRLWDKGTPLDARVLAFTAGDDYLLDNRLVRYDIQASIAHADMLAAQGLLSADDLGLIRDALTAIGEEHARGAWRVSLEQEDCQTAIENAIRGGVRRVHVISYKSTDSLLAEIFTNEGTGTLVVADLTALSPAEQLSASGA